MLESRKHLLGVRRAATVELEREKNTRTLIRRASNEEIPSAWRIASESLSLLRGFKSKWTFMLLHRRVQQCFHLQNTCAMAPTNALWCQSGSQSGIHARAETRQSRKSKPFRGLENSRAPREDSGQAGISCPWCRAKSLWNILDIERSGDRREISNNETWKPKMKKGGKLKDDKTRREETK